MDWARRIVVSGNGLAAEIQSVDGTTSLLGLAELYRRGLPAGENVVRRTLTVSFADFIPCDPREYATHFGLLIADEGVGKHQVFEVLNKGKRFLVPALALMRALFRPSSKLLVNMFAPSALERTCWLDHSNGGVRVVIDAKWATSAVVERNSNWVVPLGWMAMHPSARRMADSVHRHAMSGCLALDLSEGRTEVVMAGVQGADGIRVTEVRFLTVFPGDAPDVQDASVASRLDFVNREWAKGRNMKNTLSAELPLSISSNPQVTDAEWTVLGPLLGDQRKRAKPYLHCQRKLFNGVLGKLASGEAWQSCTYEAGDWYNAVYAHQTWNRRGTLKQALDMLREMR